MFNNKISTVTSLDGSVTTTVYIQPGQTCGCGDCDPIAPRIVVTTHVRDADGFISAMSQTIHGINPVTAYVV